MFILVSYYQIIKTFSEANQDILAGEENEDDEAAVDDPLDKQIATLKTDTIPKSAIDELMTGLKGKRGLFTSVTE